MATESDHISLANHNHGLLLHLLAHGGYPDWAATVGFYKAVHVVEAVFATDLHRDSTSHTNREETLKIAKYKGIAKDYSHLLTASRVARYLSAHGQGEFHTFTDFMDNDGVKSLIQTRLYGVEQRSLAFLTDAGKKALLKIDPATL